MTGRGTSVVSRLARAGVAASVLVAAALIAAVSAPPAGAAWAAVERVSEGTGGIEGDAASGSPSISWDGRYVAFSSTSTNLIGGDTNGVSDIFLHDRTAGTTSRISIATGGGEANGASSAPSISGDGRYVGFTSDADNLVADDTNTYSDVFIRDTLTGVTERVSTSTAGDHGNLPSGAPSVSWNGRFVAFYSLANNLVAGDTNSWWDVFIKDRNNGYTQRVSVSSGGAQSDGMSYEPAISFDGRFVAFTSAATSLVAGDTNSTDDIYLRDRVAGTTERISVASDGSNTDSGSYRSSISYDGKFVAYESLATNVVASDTNGTWDVFVRNRDAAGNERVSVATDGSQAQGNSRGRAISWDGSRVSFASTGSLVVPGDTNLVGDAFLRDRLASTTSRLSVSGAVQVSAEAFDSVIAGDGRSAGFVTAGDFPTVVSDSNGVDDVYVADSGDAPLTSTPSPVALPELTPGPPPVAPTGLVATPASDSQVDLAWSDNSSDETIFKIERRQGLGAYAFVADVAANATSYSDSGLTGATGYTYRVRAANPDARSGYSNEATATTFPSVPPAAPSDLTALAVTGIQIDLSWSDNSIGETGFKVERRSGVDPFSEVAALTPDVTAYADTELAPLTTYWYRTKATGFVGDSGYSNEASATTLADVPPASPSALQVLTTTADQAHLKWSDTATNETGFEIERAGPGGAFALVATTGPDAETYVDTGLLAATPYRYRVRATNTGGPSVFTNTATGTTKPAPVCKRSQVAFASNRAGNFEIYVANEDGSGLRRVTDTPYNESRPVFVPGSDKIVFVSDESGAGTDIFTMNLDGSNRTRLTTDPGDDASPVAAEGVIAFDSDRTGTKQIWMMNLDGSAQTQITSRTEGASDPTLAPIAAGNKLAFHGFEPSVSNLQIFTMTYTVSPFTGSTPTRMSPADTSMQGQPAFSPDGARIAFISDVEDSQFDLNVYSLAGGTRTRLTNDADFESRPWFSPDGARVFAASFAPGNSDIFSYGTGPPASIASDPATDIDPSASMASPWAVAPSSNFLAEGASAGGFETWVLLSNPDPAKTVTSCITYLTSDGVVQGPVVSIPPLSRRSVRVGATVQSFDVSTVAEGIDGTVLAERALYSTRPDTSGAHVGRAASSPAYQWYAAEGATAGGFETWVLVANAGMDPATVSVNFLTSSGVIPGPQGVTLGPGVRQSYRASTYAPGQFNVASEVISTGAPVLVERASYVNTAQKKGATDSPAVNELRRRWYLAEGAAAGTFETWILVSNPQPTDTTVDIKYLTPIGEIQGPRETIPARSRRSYNIADSGFITFNVSTDVSATAGVVAERAMYVSDPQLGRGASTGEGVPVAGNDWIAVEGATAGGFTTWVLIANPNYVPACVNVTYLRDTGPLAHIPNPVCLPPRSRRSIKVNDQVTTFDVSTRVTSTTGTDPTNGVTAPTAQPVLVERAVYTPPGASQDSTAGPAIRLG
ncbi:MAG: hypothetical protein DCC49_08400 [Acidobacteria bacterium]|nr:MAG: hypothetical protein DCC49_08400 [Acidobacteriota bacterium]